MPVTLSSTPEEEKLWRRKKKSHFKRNRQVIVVGFIHKVMYLEWIVNVVMVSV
jgi:hypothetical protein